MNDQIATQRESEVTVPVRGPLDSQLEDARIQAIAESGDVVTVDSVPDGAQLLNSDECKRLRSRWETVQVGFVDDPRNAVDQASQLVKEAVNQLRESLADTEHNLDQHFRKQDASTEERRLALQRYRSFLERLLAI